MMQLQSEENLFGGGPGREFFERAVWLTDGPSWADFKIMPDECESNFLESDCNILRAKRRGSVTFASSTHRHSENYKTGK